MLVSGLQRNDTDDHDEGQSLDDDDDDGKFDDFSHIGHDHGDEQV